MTSVEELTCPAPLEVPRDLAAPSPGYRRRVALAFLALLSFIAVYLARFVNWKLYLAPDGRAVSEGYDGNLMSASICTWSA